MPRSKSSREIPPPLEMECLKALWQLGEANVHQVRDHLSASRPLAYTTVMTLLERLAKRGRAARRKQGRGFLYKAEVTREEMQRLAVQSLALTLFEGSVESLMNHLRADHSASTVQTEAEVPDLDATLL
jgi:BlaI family transcriptional regulator, penicillinase repressor